MPWGRSSPWCSRRYRARSRSSDGTVPFFVNIFFVFVLVMQLVFSAEGAAREGSWRFCQVRRSEPLARAEAASVPAHLGGHPAHVRVDDDRHGVPAEDGHLHPGGGHRRTRSWRAWPRRPPRSRRWSLLAGVLAQLFERLRGLHRAGVPWRRSRCRSPCWRSPHLARWRVRGRRGVRRVPRAPSSFVPAELPARRPGAPVPPDVRAVACCRWPCSRGRRARRCTCRWPRAISGRQHGRRCSR